MNVIREEHSERTTQYQSLNKEARPHLPPVPKPEQEANARPRRSMFDRVSHKGSMEEVGKMIRSEMKAHMAKMMKTVGHIGGSSVAALVIDYKFPFT